MAVKLPCVDVCTFDGKTRLCVGFFRTLDEIRTWKKMTDHRRHQVINDRARRRARLQRASPGVICVAGGLGRLNPWRGSVRHHGSFWRLASVTHGAIGSHPLIGE
ncbi:DUF1289 domain-containing protein [Paraburkholderia sp. 5N]|uniref:DUF1289 domain-containing protein n=1 Tax=Paraburkholderia elongata TaxID=2675747 RepID=A0A972P1P9_9BURK|nr:DUF1289 domain-containing protein [Paraburkholderia elongata]